MSDLMECRACDGTGWVEGGTAIRTSCHRCGGLGTLSDLVHRPEAPVLDFEKAAGEARKKGYEFDAAHVGEGCRAELSRQHTAQMEGKDQEIERLKAAIRESLEEMEPSGPAAVNLRTALKEAP